MTRIANSRTRVSRGRPHETSLRFLSDRELEAELTVAASTMGSRRWQRYEALLEERRRRRQPTAG